MTVSQLRTEIKEKKIKKLYLFKGEEDLLKSELLSLLFSSLGVSKEQAFNGMMFENKDFSVDSLADAVLSVPFLSDRKAVVVKDLVVSSLTDSEFAKLSELLPQIPDSSCLIFIFSSGMAEQLTKGKGKQFLSMVQKQGEVIGFDPLDKQDAADFCIKLVKKHKASLSLQNARFLTDYVGTDLGRLKNETEKLISYAGPREITREDIQIICCEQVEESVYNLGKRLSALDLAGANQILDRLLTLRVEPLMILATLSGNFVDLARAKLAGLGSVPLSQALAEFGYKKNLEFRLKNAYNESKKYSPRMLCDILTLLSEAEYKLKSAPVLPEVVLRILLTNIVVILSDKRS